MDRRNFLKQASGYALAAAGTMTGIGHVFAADQTPLNPANRINNFIKYSTHEKNTTYIISNNND